VKPGDRAISITVCLVVIETRLSSGIRRIIFFFGCFILTYSNREVINCSISNIVLPVPNTETFHVYLKYRFTSGVDVQILSKGTHMDN